MEEAISSVKSIGFPSDAPISRYSQWDIEQAYLRHIRGLRKDYSRKLRRARRKHDLLVLQAKK